MAYELVITQTAAEDLERLLADFPQHERNQAIDAIGEACERFAAKPPYRTGRWETPSFTLEFKIGDVTYYWAAAYHLTEDETKIAILHIFRFGL